MIGHVEFGCLASSSKGLKLLKGEFQTNMGKDHLRPKPMAQRRVGTDA
jgi:hypothetical protein